MACGDLALGSSCSCVFRHEDGPRQSELAHECPTSSAVGACCIAEAVGLLTWTPRPCEAGPTGASREFGPERKAADELDMSHMQRCLRPGAAQVHNMQLSHEATQWSHSTHGGSSEGAAGMDLPSLRLPQELC